MKSGGLNSCNDVGREENTIIIELIIIKLISQVYIYKQFIYKNTK